MNDDMSFKEMKARVTHLEDQVTASAAHMGQVVAAFYNALHSEGIPAATCKELTLMYLYTILQNGLAKKDGA